MKNILIIGPFPKPISGVSLANEVISEGLVKKGWKVKIIDTEFSEKISQSHGKINLNKLSVIKTYFQVYKIFYVNIVYITIGQTFYGLLKYYPFLVFAKLFNKKTVVHLHGNYLHNEYMVLTKIKQKIFSHILNKFDYSIVLSESLKQNFTPFFEDNRIFVLNNFFQNYLKFDKEYLVKNKKFDDLNILFLSNLMEQKGINILLGALKIINEKGINVNVKIAGNKVVENNVDNLIKELDFVKYIGVVDGQEKKDLFYWSTVFCLPTFYKMEGQPISILEAMATANLILTTKHAGIIDVCSEENAIFVEKKSIYDLVNKILFIYNNKHLLKDKGLLNYEYASERFSESIFIDNANNILEQCLN